MDYPRIGFGGWLFKNIVRLKILLALTKATWKHKKIFLFGGRVYV